jgi:hypothetical protein
MEKYILIAADSIKTLRGIDVFRVIDQFDTEKEQRKMVGYLLKHREDLEPYIDEATEELWHQEK